MLAAKRSLGNLRCSSFATTASTAPALPSQSRSLMSAVLLSRSQFERKTVKQLQEELGERGLSTRGRKNILVDRLLESVSKNTVGSSVASASSPAAFSTSAVKKAAPVASKPEVETPAGEAQGDTITAAPGIIVEKKDAAEAAENADEVPGGVIEMPNAVFLPLAEKESQEAHAELMIVRALSRTSSCMYPGSSHVLEIDSIPSPFACDSRLRQMSSLRMKTTTHSLNHSQCTLAG